MNGCRRLKHRQRRPDSDNQRLVSQLENITAKYKEMKEEHETLLAASEQLADEKVN